ALRCRVSVMAPSAPPVAAACGLLALVLLVGACNITPEPAAPPRPARAAAGSLFGYAWQWTDESGRATSFANFRGVPLIITEIYTSCTSTCPRTVAELRKLSEQ